MEAILGIVVGLFAAVNIAPQLAAIASAKAAQAAQQRQAYAVKKLEGR